MILCTGRIAFLLSVSRSGASGTASRPETATPPQPVVPDWIFVSTSYIPPVGKTCFGSVGPSLKGAALGEGALPGKCSFANPVGARALRRIPSVRPRHPPPTAGLTTLVPTDAERLDDRPPGRPDATPLGSRTRVSHGGKAQGSSPRRDPGTRLRPDAMGGSPLRRAGPTRGRGGVVIGRRKGLARPSAGVVGHEAGKGEVPEFPGRPRRRGAPSSSSSYSWRSSPSRA